MAEDTKIGGSALDVTLPLGEHTLAARPALPPKSCADASSPCFNVAELIGERYRIIRLIGEGGMGEVYEAEDLLLKDRVALKTVRQNVAGDEKVIERFKREIQLARRVTHPNVCRIFDVGLHRRRGDKGELAFLTMELLDGETLSQRLGRVGRLECDEARTIVAQASAALDAAHQVGVVHRDFKSSNIMLVENHGRLRAVVTDFGLARGRSAAADPTITGDGGVVGSPSYMAPEQVEGREITSAADIYSFGVVMYEMVTGRLPFVGETPLSTAVMRLREEPLTPCAHVADLDSDWEGAILACLARDPAARPTSARAVAELVAPDRSRSRFGLRFIVPAIALLAAAALGWKMWNDRPAPPPQEAPSLAFVPAAPDKSGRRSVAVLGFKNLTGHAEESWISGALAEMISTELAASTDVRTVPSESVARAKRELGLADEISFAPDTLAKLRTILDTDYVLTGSYMALGREAGARIRFDLKLQDTRTGEIVAVLSQTGSEAELVDLVAASGEALRGKLSLGELSPAEREGVRAAMPKSDVIKLYTEGLEQLQVEACASARAPLEQAVAAAPDWPRAHSALAQALYCLGYEERARAEALRAVDLSQRLPEHLRLEAQARAYEVGRDPTRAQEVYSRLFQQFPDSFDYGYKLASFQLMNLEDEAFKKTVAELRRLDPPAGDSPRVDMLEAYQDLIAGKNKPALDKAKAAYKKAEDRGERLVAASALMAQARVMNELKRLDEALAAVGKARAIFEAASDQDGVAKAIAVEAALREGKGDSTFAQKAEDQIAAIAGNLRNPTELLRFRLIMADTFGRQGKYQTVLSALEDAREISRSLKDSRSETQIVIQLSGLYLMLGEVREARDAIDSMPLSLVPPDMKAPFLTVVAMLDTSIGDADSARALLGKAESLGGDQTLNRMLIDLSYAQLAIEDGTYKEAEKIARRMLSSKNGVVLGPPSRMALATALVGQKRWKEADAVLTEVGSAPFMSGLVWDLGKIALAGRIVAATDLAAGRKMLDDGRARADAAGLQFLSLELRLRIAQAEVDRGDPKVGRQLLDAVAEDAHDLGLLAIERHARRGG